MNKDPNSKDYKLDCKLADYLCNIEEDIVMADGLSDAFIGIGSQGPNGETVAVYDSMKIVEKLMADGMDQEQALEFYEYNIAGAYVGPKTPMFMVKIPREMWDHSVPCSAETMEFKVAKKPKAKRKPKK